MTPAAEKVKSATHWRKVFALTVFGALMLAALAFANSGRAAIETPPPPSVWSDKADYAPGEQVTLSGANWAPGESVHIRVNDDAGQTWSRDADVTADGNGAISDQFNLPDWFVAVYNVTATGASSGTATWSFTDADATTTTLTSSANPSNLNDPVTFTATVKRSATSTVVTVGSIKFGTGSNCTGGFTELQAAQAPNASGQATYSTSTLPAGNTTLRACYLGTGGASGTQDSTATLTQTVNAKQNQTITFNAPVGKKYGDPDFDPGATASSGLPVSYSSSTASVCTIVSGKVHIVAAGDCTVTASQVGDASYNPAPDVTRTFTIAKADQTITFGALSPKTLGDPPFTVSASGGGSGNPVTFSASPSTTCTSGGTNGATITITGIGTCTVTADQAGNVNYKAAPSVSRTFAVSYNFTGFFAPVDNNGVCNVAKAGSAIPVKFTLHGYQGMNIFASGYPKATTGTCSASNTDAIEETATSSQSGLNYDATSDQYVYVWKTDKAWAGKAILLTVRLSDGTDHTARFSFTR